MLSIQNMTGPLNRCVLELFIHRHIACLIGGDVLDSVVSDMMTNQNQSLEKWEEDMRSVEDHPQLLADLLRSTREWARKPWKDFPKGDLTAFFIQDEHDQRLTS